MTGDVAPFRRRSRPAKAPTRPRGTQVAEEQNAAARAGYAEAVGRQAAARNAKRAEWLLDHGTVVPARITIALDIRGLEGPEVDEMCGAAEPDVDLWEIGELAPTREQVLLLAGLTEFPVGWFYKPIEPGTLTGPLWMCYSDRRGCQLVEPHRIDERGVLHYGGEPDRTLERVLAANAQPALPVFSPDDPAPEPVRTPPTAPRAPRPARRRPRAADPAAQPPLQPPGSLSDTERAALLNRIDQSRRTARRRRPGRT